jgi:hypothetical protein
MTTLGEWRRDYTKVRAPALAIYATSFFPVDRTDAELVKKLRDFEGRVVDPFRQASIARIHRELPNVQVVELDGRSHMSIGVVELEALAAAIKRFLLPMSDDAR